MKTLLTIVVLLTGTITHADPMPPPFLPYVIKTPEGAHLYREDANTLRFSGKYTEGLTSYMSMEYFKKPYQVLKVTGSPGGLLGEAIEMSQFINDKDILIHVTPEALCISACSYTVIWAEDRVVEGTLAFHPPYMRSIPPGATFFSLFQQGYLTYTQVIRLSMDAGVPLYFMELVAQQSDPFTYVVIYGEGLDVLHASHILDEEPEEFKRYYWIKTAEELKEK